MIVAPLLGDPTLSFVATDQVGLVGVSREELAGRRLLVESNFRLGTHAHRGSGRERSSGSTVNLTRRNVRWYRGTCQTSMEFEPSFDVRAFRPTRASGGVYCRYHDAQNTRYRNRIRVRAPAQTATNVRPTTRAETFKAVSSGPIVPRGHNGPSAIVIRPRTLEFPNT